MLLYRTIEFDTSGQLQKLKLDMCAFDPGADVKIPFIYFLGVTLISLHSCCLRNCSDPYVVTGKSVYFIFDFLLDQDLYVSADPF